MAPRRPLKRESTTFGGLATPVPSYRGSAGTISPKREVESSEFIELSSDESEEEPQVFDSNHGLQIEEDIYTDRDFRTPSVSAPPSRVTRQRAAPPHQQPSRVPRSTPPLHPRASTSNTQNMPAPRAQGLEYLGRNVKLLVDAISDLQTIGLSHAVGLPELVLVGDQSAGKSSLMSALTGVQLPRAQGICTKCPANITTSPADEWSCKVSLQQNYRYDGRRKVDVKSVKKTDPFPPWIRQDLVVTEFMVLTDRSQLEEAVMWAQLALLNHDEDPASFIPGSGYRTVNGFEREKERAVAKFSPNLIAIEISGPDLPSLSFYDLPGIFAFAAREEDQYLSNVIQNLAQDYIKRPNAVIIWVVAMKTDAANSHSGKVIRECRAQNRAVGVLTNPDHVFQKHDEYERILSGEDYVLEHGYFVTKQPGDGAHIPPGPDYHAIARQQEDDFFDSAPPWTQEWKEFRPRCGTRPIQKFLSCELARQIADSIPRLFEQLDTRTMEVDAKLLLYPDLPETERRPMIVDVLGKFSRDAIATMNGQVTSTPSRLQSFRSDFKKLSEQFSACLSNGKPMISISHPSDREREKIERIEIDLLSETDDNDEVEEDPIVDHRNNKKRANTETPSKMNGKKQKTEDGFRNLQTPPPYQMPVTNTYHSVKHAPAPFNRSVARGNPSPFAGTIFEDFNGLGRGFGSLASIREDVKTFTLSGLFGTVNDETYDELCLRSVKSWDRPAEAFVEKAISMVRTQLEKILDENLRIHAQTHLPKKAKEALKEFVDVHANKVRAYARDLYEHEKHIITMSNELLQQIRNRELEHLMERRKKLLLQLEVDHQIRVNPKKRPDDKLSPEEKAKALEKMRAEIKEDDLLKKKMNAFTTELQVIALVRAYYVVASQRYVDNVVQSMHAIFFKGIREGITSYVEEKIGVNSSEGEQVCRRLLKEDDSSDKIRRELKAEKQKLARFADRLTLLVRQLKEPDQEEGISNNANADADPDNNAAANEQSHRLSNYQQASVDDPMDESSSGDEPTTGPERPGI